jgi:hypothetical protein
MPLVERDSTAIHRKDVEGDFTVPVFTCPALDEG